MQAATQVPTEAEPVELPEPWHTILWRQEELERAGYPTTIALELADRRDVDLHDACALLNRGATLDQAMRILGVDR